jgi:transposase
MMSLLGLLCLPLCCRTTIRKLLTSSGLSWKKATKLLAKAKRAKRLEYMAQFHLLYAEMMRGERTLIYLDEAHIHQDVDLGYGWYYKGKRWYIPSTTPGLHAKINWYGAYDFTNGRAMIWAYPRCDGPHTAEFLERVAEWSQGKPKVTIIWDGSPVHRAKEAQQKAKDLGMEVIPLPGYSPDLNPIEGLWKWMREEVTYAYCQPSLDELFKACKGFIDGVNNPEALTSRLRPPFELDPEREAFLCSD